jgi:transketolase
MPSTANPIPPVTDIRDAFFGEVYRLAKEDRRIMVLTDDQSAFALDKMRSDLPAQYFNVGIAEQNLISVAAGMALGGLKPYVCGISNFVSLRCCEQVSVDLCAMNLPVTIVASGGGLTYASDGPTHHSTQDVAVMRTMPNLTILNPSDSRLTSACARMCNAHPGPSYVRIEKGLLPELYLADQSFESGFGVLRQGTDVLIISTGFMTHVAVRVAERLHNRGVQAGVLDLFRLKPLQDEFLLEQLRRVRAVVVLEEQTPVGGVGSLVCEILAEASLGTPVRRFHLPDAPCYRYGSRDWLHRQFGLDEAKIEASIAKWFQTLLEPSSLRTQLTL